MRRSATPASASHRCFGPANTGFAQSIASWLSDGRAQDTRGACDDGAAAGPHALAGAHRDRRLFAREEAVVDAPRRVEQRASAGTISPRRSLMQSPDGVVPTGVGASARPRSTCTVSGRNERNVRSKESRSKVFC